MGNFAEVAERHGTSDMEYMWCPLNTSAQMADMSEEEVTSGPTARQPSYCVDAAQVREKNPARYVNAAAKKEQCGKVNVRMCELGGVMYMQTLKSIAPGTELITSYGDNYWEDFGNC